MSAAMLRMPAGSGGDSSDVAVALEVAGALWDKGNHEEGLRWLKRAIEAATEAGDAPRATGLARASAELEASLSREGPMRSVPATAPPIPSEAPVVPGPSRPPAVQPAPHLASVPVATPGHAQAWGRDVRMRVSVRTSARDPALMVLRPGAGRRADRARRDARRLPRARRRGSRPARGLERRWRPMTGRPHAGPRRLQGAGGVSRAGPRALRRPERGRRSQAASRPYLPRGLAEPGSRGGACRGAAGPRGRGRGVVSSGRRPARPHGGRAAGRGASVVDVRESSGARRRGGSRAGPRARDREPSPERRREATARRASLPGARRSRGGDGSGRAARHRGSGRRGELRGLYVEIAQALGSPIRAAETPARAAKKAKSRRSVRRRLGFQVATLYLREGELRHARNAFLEVVLAEGGGPLAVEAAQRLLPASESGPSDPPRGGRRARDDRPRFAGRGGPAGRGREAPRAARGDAVQRGAAPRRASGARRFGPGRRGARVAPRLPRAARRRRRSRRGLSAPGAPDERRGKRPRPRAEEHRAPRRRERRSARRALAVVRADVRARSPGARRAPRAPRAGATHGGPSRVLGARRLRSRSPGSERRSWPASEGTHLVSRGKIPTRPSRPWDSAWRSTRRTRRRGASSRAS